MSPCRLKEMIKTRYLKQDSHTDCLSWLADDEKLRECAVCHGLPGSRRALHGFWSKKAGSKKKHCKLCWARSCRFCVRHTTQLLQNVQIVEHMNDRFNQCTLRTLKVGVEPQMKNGCVHPLSRVLPCILLFFLFLLFYESFLGISSSLISHDWAAMEEYTFVCCGLVHLTACLLFMKSMCIQIC